MSSVVEMVKSLEGAKEADGGSNPWTSSQVHPSLSAELPDINVEEFVKVVETRRSVRRFTDEPVPDDVLNKCLDLALLSANSCNLQPWEFRIVKTPEMKDQLVHALMNQNAAKTSQVLIAVIAHTDSWRSNAQAMLDNWPEPEIPKSMEALFSSYAYFQYGLKYFGLQGLFKRIVYGIGSLKQPVWQGPVNMGELREWSTKTTSLAAQTFMLAMRAHGYDTCPMEGFDMRRVRKIMKLSKHERPIMFISGGKRAPSGLYQERIRLPRDRFIKTV